MKNVLVKLGGSVITDGSYRKSIVKQLVQLRDEGFNICIVHGGGKLISHYLNALNIKSEFHEGLRITSPEVLEVAMMALIGRVNKDLVKDFNQFGSQAIGLCGGDGNLVTCNKFILPGGQDIGMVGVPETFNKKLFDKLVDLGAVLVIATIAIGPEGYYNVNADHMAAFVAQEASVDHLVFVSDVDGVLHPQTKEVYVELSKEKIDSLTREGIITDGMLPKLNSCLQALDKGVSKVTILNGRREGSIIDAVIGKELIATRIV